jgi:two-component system NarL family response regulator
MIGRQYDMCVVAEASNGRDALELWKKHRPDVTLLDLRMPQLDRVGVIHAVRKENSAARIVMLTTYDTDEQIYQAMRAGAKAYLLKDGRREEILECIRKVHHGETCVPPHLTAKLATRIGAEPLSKRETDVLVLLGRGKSNKEIGASVHIR